MTERRVLLAAAVSAIFLAWYAQFLTRWTKPAQPTGAVAQAPANTETRSPAYETPQLSAQESVAIIESEDITLEIGEHTGAVRAATVKRFSLRIAGAVPLFGVYQGLKPLELHVVDRSANRLTLESRTQNAQAYQISYVLDQSNLLCNIMIRGNTTDAKTAMLSAWVKGDMLSGSNNQLEIIALHNDKSGKTAYKRFLGEHRTARIVPRGTLLLTLSERHFCQAIRPSVMPEQVTILPAVGQIATLSELPGQDRPEANYQATVYLGPRDYFAMRTAGFEQAFPIGIMGQIGLGLLVALAWIASWTKNYGVAIVVFSAGITCVMAPFTLMSFRSMKKMQELKPQIDKLMAKHKDDPKRANVEVFALYKAHRVSPLSGCLPMLLQLPIFFALFQAISHFIELRGKSFLWIGDLSLPDRLATLPVTLPILGNELNALPIIMAAAMYLQTKITQRQMPSSGANPAASLLSGPLMSVMFGVMFYHIPSGLVLYWLTNSLTSMTWYLLAK